MATVSNPEFLEHKIPDAITRAKDVSALSDYTFEKYGKALDKRLGWDKAHKQAINMRRVAVRQLEQKEKEVIMDKTKWPWNEGYKFYCDGPNPAQSNACYLTDTVKGTQFFVPEDSLAAHLADSFELPEPEPFVHMSTEAARLKAKEEAIAKAKAEADASQKLEDAKASAKKAAVASKEESRLKATTKPVEASVDESKPAE